MPNHMKMFKAANPWNARAALFSQGNLLRRFPVGHASRKGVCRALCEIYISSQKMGESFGYILGRSASKKGASSSSSSAAAAAAEDEGISEERKTLLLDGLANFASKIQESVKPPKATTLLGALCETVAQDCASLSLAVLEGDSRSLKWKCAREIADIVNTPSNEGKYFLVFLPNHVVCAFCDGTDSTVFDPNFGQTKCAKQNFASLFATFLTNPNLVRDYELAADVDIYIVAVY
jgi:hypothetical protein